TTATQLSHTIVDESRILRTDSVGNRPRRVPREHNHADIVAAFTRIDDRLPRVAPRGARPVVALTRGVPHKVRHFTPPVNRLVPQTFQQPRHIAGYVAHTQRLSRLGRLDGGTLPVVAQR